MLVLPFLHASVASDLAGHLPPSSSSSLVFRTLCFVFPAISLAAPWGVFALLCPWPFPVGGSWDWVLGDLLLPMLLHCELMQAFLPSLAPSHPYCLPVLVLDKVTKHLRTQNDSSL